MVSELTDSQWEALQPLLPPHNRQRHPRADDQRTLKGILSALHTRCRWQDMPRRYKSPVTCWRRLRQWQRQGVWERLWRTYLAMLDEQGRLAWSQAFLDGTFVPAKRERSRRAHQTGQGQPGDAGHRWARRADRGIGAQCPAGGNPPGGGDAGDGMGAASPGAAPNTPPHPGGR